MNGELYDVVLSRLLDDEGADEVVVRLVDAACRGADPLEAALAGTPTLTPPRKGATPAVVHRVGAYLTEISVTGFRGIADKSTLSVEPGPGLTLVIGRNGSGKSSLSEGLETLLTGRNQRWWDGKANMREWVQGWKNLHYDGTPSLEARFVTEGATDPVTLRRQWGSDDFEDNTLELTRGAAEIAGLDALGWDDALDAYRPILSYKELGALYERPSALYDKLKGLLGLEELAAARKLLGEERKQRASLQKQAKAALERLCGRLASHTDARAERCLVEVKGTKWKLDALDEILAESADEGDEGSEMRLLRALAGLSVPTEESVAAAVGDLRDAVARQAALAGTAVERDSLAADLLERALRFQRDFGDANCPVCGREAALDLAWQAETGSTVERLRASASEAKAAGAAVAAALRQARGLIQPVPPVVGDVAAIAELGLDGAALQSAWSTWANVADLAPLELVTHLETTHGAVLSAVGRLVDTASERLAQIQAAWEPLRRDLTAWSALAHHAVAAKEQAKEIKAAEDWLKKAEAELRDERFGPLADHAQRVWRTLRQDSNVDLTRVSLEGSATRRRVALNVSVDGVEGVALGVMSQGELNALALSLFLPRASLEESPFRFMVIDDPVQSMDPARVDGLARALADTAKTRQVVVFTHDDRLFEAVRRLQIEADVREVQRRGHSVIEIVQAMDPVQRYFDDAWRVARAEDSIGRAAAERVVPGFCRMGFEAAFTKAIRRRRLNSGARHIDVERAIEEAKKLTSLASLGLFDEAGREAEVMRYLNNHFDSRSADVFKLSDKGAHKGYSGDFTQFVRTAERLAKGLEALK